MMFKKEINNEQNRNYHIDSNNIGEIKKYLEMNKTIHTNSFNKRMKKIIITLLLTIIFSNMFPLLTFIILTYELIGVIVDFECVNLQNYNLCRLSNKKTEIVLKKIEEKNNKQYEKNMKNGINVIERTFDNTSSIPTIDDIINNIKSKEELIELLNYSKNELNKRIKKKKL